MTSDQFLKFLLRFTAIISALAVIAVYMPRSWMEISHQGLGLGPFPEGPITGYLARSASALYAIFGGLLWILSGDLARYHTVIRYYALAMLVFGCTMLGVDIRAGLPLWWILLEGPSVVVLGALILWLQWRGAGGPQPRQAVSEASQLSGVR